MIAVDTNIIVYALRADTPQHGGASKRLADLVANPAPWGIPVFCLGELLRLITHRRLFDNPHTPTEAAQCLRELLKPSNVLVLRPGPSFESILIDLVERHRLKGNAIFDAQIAALCYEHGVSKILTEDRDFERFDGLVPLRL